MSQTDESSQSASLQLGPLQIENFAELSQRLKDSVDRFQGDQTPENFAAIITSLAGFGLSGADLWQQAAAYAKRNPLRVAALAGLAFFALKGLVSQGQTARKLIH